MSGKSSFYWAMQFMARPKRQAMAALYQFARQIDDLADGALPQKQALSRLQALEADLARLKTDGHSTDPLLVPLVEHIQRFDLPLDEIQLLIDGMKSDLTAPLSAPDRAELTLYCRQVAGSVGVLAVHIFGRPMARDFAIALGHALQLTNILRDVSEDAARNRLYLPRWALEQAGMDAKSPLPDLIRDPRLAKAMAALSEQAEHYYNQAEGELKRIGTKGLAPALMMKAVYHAQFIKMKQANWPLLAPKLGPSAKLFHSLRGLIGG